MNEITTLLACLHPLLDTTTYRQLRIINQTLLVMTGRITMLGISRWAGKGGSYRTVQRFFTKDILWGSLNWAVVKTFLKQSGAILISGDATTVTKSGKKTFGLGRFFSSIYSRAVPGIAFQTLSLLDVGKRTSWPNNSALYFKWNGRRPIYGDRIDYCNLPAANLKSEKTKDHIRTRIYQLNVIHKKFADPLNVVIISKKNVKTGKVARVILFSSDLELEGENIIDYYRLRFQIEFNFRDAKQHWGLEDFMVIKEQSVFNAANLSLWMVNVSQAILMTSGEESILDLKARHHGLRYAQELFKILPENTKPINIVQLFEKIPVLGRIHVEKMAA